MGILANVDESILRVNLDHGFKITSMPGADGIKFISNLEHLPLMETHKKLISLCCRYDKLYYIDYSFKSDIEIDGEGMITKVPTEVTNLKNNFVPEYLIPVIRLMRLFKQGNICMPLHYFYYIDNNSPKLYISAETTLYISQELCTLEGSEILELQKFIQNTTLPFKEPFLQLAFENFELSYQTHNINLSFLSLMISLETLFNPSEQELRYRISRNTAIVLGKEYNDSKKIFSEVKNLYDKRSNIVHTGKSNLIKNEDLLKLRQYVRESIKEINKIGKNKDELLDLLNSYGFGWRQGTGE